MVYLFDMKIIAMKDDYRQQVAEYIKENWAEVFIISRGRKIYPAELEGLVALDDNNEIIGFVTYEIIDRVCEVTTLDALRKFEGIGTRLLDQLKDNLRKQNIKRLWLITTNDNIDAIRFYQKRGWKMVAIHVDALDQSRKLKPKIPLIGEYGIPLQHEIEFEYPL